MKIKYKKKQVRINFLLGMVWLANAIAQTIVNVNLAWFEYLWYLFPAFYLITYFYQKREQYLTIRNETIKQNWPFGKKIKLNHIEKIRHFAGEYTLQSGSQTMKININAIEEESLSNLKMELKKLNVEWV